MVFTPDVAQVGRGLAASSFTISGVAASDDGTHLAANYMGVCVGGGGGARGRGGLLLVVGGCVNAKGGSLRS